MRVIDEGSKENLGEGIRDRNYNMIAACSGANTEKSERKIQSFHSVIWLDKYMRVCEPQ